MRNKNWWHATGELGDCREERRFVARTTAAAMSAARSRFPPSWVIYLWSATDLGRRPQCLVAVRVNGKWRQPSAESPAEGGSGSGGASGAVGGSSGAGGASAPSDGASSGTT